MADQKVTLRDNHNKPQEFNAKHAERLLSYPGTLWKKDAGATEDAPADDTPTDATANDAPEGETTTSRRRARP